ncbi:Neutral/alkaline non-lysosomal ceramidase [Symmachiella dynata]|uniref:neutral/alkaline non-lysosomal ceramidase N-terminal domain-containing protein n=1 Tax=Symmachiella dynata TaxID=2527995 RepID=UPI00118A8E68|nr:neutral/alkaline non-lysosomal ceramidase N-terminal domain-containing protein [Symmachiella dynata]QDT49542.1 Neutral/alkaline non-lysosomal ceramidase [Symmachiella dynata]
MSRRLCISTLLLILTCLCFVDTARAELLAGAAKESIVPPFPTKMGGFFDRLEPFTGVHDEIYARALVLDNGQTQVLIIGSDLINVSADITARVRENIARETGIPPQHILVSSTHNHSSPSVNRPGQIDDPNEKSAAFFVERFTKVGLDAFKNRVPARAGFHAGELKGATRNRQQRNDLVDTQVGVLRVEEREGRKTIATLFNFTGHPVIIGSNNLLLSGEYPGAAERAVENMLGGVAIFTQGAAGDVTVHRSGDPFMEIERLGRTVAGEVIKASGFIRGEEEIELAGATTTLNLAARQIPSLDETQAAIQSAEAELKAVEDTAANKELREAIRNRLRLYSMNERFAKGLADGSLKMPEQYQAEVQVLQIGDLVIVSIPGEIFVEYALELRQRIKQLLDKSMVLAGYSNGYLGYIVTPRAAVTGGYEASISRVRPNAGRQMTEAAMELVGGLKQSKTP